MRYHNVPVIYGEWGAPQKDNCTLELLDDGINPLIAMFDLKYIDSDHHVRMIAAGAKTGDPNSSLFCLSDQDYGITGAGDEVSIRGQYLHIMPPYYFEESERSVNGTGRNTVVNSISIPGLSADQVFVLRGFLFQGKKERNHHLRQISVRFNASTSAIDVSFIDNSPEDDEYDFTVYYYVLNSFCREGGYNFCLRNFTDRFTFRESTTRPKFIRGMGLIAGFSFRFVENDHHLNRIFIDLTPENVYHVAFTDKEGGKLVSADIDYVILQPTN